MAFGDNEATPLKSEVTDTNTLTSLFRAFWLLIVLLNVIDGCLPASLVEIHEEMHLTYTSEGALGGLVYAGLVVSSFFAGPMLQEYNVRKILAISCCLEGLFCIGFGLAPYTWVLLACRFLIGLFMGFSAVFAPVWVDEFAPKDRQTLWMSLMQLSCPLGIMLGYGCGILTSTYGIGNIISGWGYWRVPFVIQGILIIPFSLMVLMVPDKYFTKTRIELPDNSSNAPILEKAKRKNQRRQSVLVDGQTAIVSKSNLDAIQNLQAPVPARSTALSVSSQPLRSTQTILDHVKILIMNKVYICTVFGLAALYFVVTGIQFWITPYLVTDLHENVALVGGCFIFASATGPTAGVIAGGVLIDRYGGYQGKRQAPIALKMCLFFVVLAVGCSVGAAFGPRLYVVMPLIWILLFAGGAIVPPATGILMSCVHPQLKNLSSALAAIIFNIFGYFLSPTLSGYVMSITSRQWGFRLVLFWSGFGAIFLFLAWFAAVRRADRDHEYDVSESDSEVKSRATSNSKSVSKNFGIKNQNSNETLIQNEDESAAKITESANTSSRDLDYFSDIDYEDDGFGGELPALKDIGAEMIYNRGLRSQSVAGLALIVPAIKEHNKVVESDQLKSSQSSV